MIDRPYLLDTSTLIWALVSPEKLSAKARKALNAGPLVLSVVSYWEVVIKSQKGMLNVADPVNWWFRAIEILGVTSSPFERPIYRSSRGCAIFTRIHLTGC